MWKAIVLLACVLLAACQEKNVDTVQVRPRPEAAAVSATPFFVGRWAAEKRLCGTAAWTFAATRISTPGHVVCTFRRPQPASVYEIDATCTAEGPPAHYRLRISYAQSAKALLVEGGPFEPVGLMKCE